VWTALATQSQKCALVFVVGKLNRSVITLEFLEHRIVLERSALTAFQLLKEILSSDAFSCSIDTMLIRIRNTMLHVDHQGFESLVGAEKGKRPGPQMGVIIA
jgi:hypothetical protein